MLAMKALLSMCICADSPEPSLPADAIGTEISCTDANTVATISCDYLHFSDKAFNVNCIRPVVGPFFDKKGNYTIKQHDLKRAFLLV